MRYMRYLSLTTLITLTLLTLSCYHHSKPLYPICQSCVEILDSNGTPIIHYPDACIQPIWGTSQVNITHRDGTLITIHTLTPGQMLTTNNLSCSELDHLRRSQP